MSKKYIIINFNRFGDIFQSAHLISSIKESNPHSQVHYITFKENLKALNILNNVDEVHTIDRKKITAFFSNAIYSDGLAFNELEQSLSRVRVGNHDQIINYSNDRLSTYLASYLSEGEENYNGIRFSSINTVEYSSDTAILFNDIETSYAPTPFNFNDCYHKLLGLTQAQSSDAIIFNSEHDNKAKEGLELLRLSKRSDQGNGLIVGIQVTSSTPSKDISHGSLIGLIGQLQDNPRTIPVLLVSPAASEKEKVDELNAYFSNELISIESDFSALPSVLKNLDLLVTPDTSVKHLADLTQTLCIEVSQGESPFLKQGTIGTRNYILTSEPSQRAYTKHIKEKQCITDEDIFSACIELLKLDGDVSYNKETIIYRPLKLNGGTYYMPIKGEINNRFELRRFFSRTIIEKNYFDYFNQNSFMKMISVFDETEIKEFIRDEQESVGKVMKDLLATLRSLIQLQENNKNASGFISSLEQLISNAFHSELSAVSVLDFRARIEAITSSDLKTNLKETESLLYALKGQLKNTLTILQHATTKSEIKSNTRRQEDSL